uniref:Putative basal body component n=1 Tax=Trypanosoma vivax (strain Y486) TaxID=1055687 RepID=G0U1J7_TRYVY|nr:putative basal body component, fragment [Trypanosoma vivax Y486]
MDQLLEEYLRVINSKDTEIQDLTRGLEESRCELRRREDSHRKSTIETEQELHKLQKRLRKAEEKCRKSEEDVDKLVRHNEQLKVQLSGLHREMMGACGEQAKIQQQVSKADNIEREAMQRLADAHSAQEQRILEQEATIRELRESCEKMQCTMQTMITPQRLDAVISEQKAPLIAATKAQAEEIGELRKLLAEAQQAGPKLRSKLGELKTLYSQLQKNLSDTTRELESERRQRNLEHDAGKEAIARYKREVKQIRGAVANHGCDSAYTIQKKYLDELQHQKARLGHDIEELSRLHAEELRAVHDDKNKELSKMALQHGADIALLRQEITDLTARAAREGEQQMKEYRRKEEQFHREKTELECARLEIAHQADQITALKEQIRATEQRLGTERADVDHENKELRQQHDRVRHRLEECTRDQARSEQEIRELRNELLALHKVLHEKERALTTEQEKCAEESRRLIAANTVKEALQIQLDELRRQTQKHQERLLAVRQGAERTSSTAAAIQSQMEERVADLTRSLNASEVSKRRMERHFHNEEKKVGALERELAESRRREVELSTQLQARRTEITALKERCANLESLKNINDLTLAETRQRERELFEKIEEMRSAQQMMQICFDKQQEQLEAGRRMHEQGINRSDILYRDGQ